MKLIKILQALLFLTIISPGLSVAAVMTFDGNNQVTGATGLVVGDLGTYDVAFTEGSCINLFSGCDNAVEDFTFSTIEGARDAMKALAELIYVEDSIYDNDASLILGCETGLCVIATTFSFDEFGKVRTFVYSNRDEGSQYSDGFYTSNLTKSRNTTLMDWYTYAVWTPHGETTNVSEPSTLSLFMIPLAGLMLLRIKNS